MLSFLPNRVDGTRHLYRFRLINKDSQIFPLFINSTIHPSCTTWPCPPVNLTTSAHLPFGYTCELPFKTTTAPWRSQDSPDLTTWRQSCPLRRLLCARLCSARWIAATRPCATRGSCSHAQPEAYRTRRLPCCWCMPSAAPLKVCCNTRRPERLGRGKEKRRHMRHGTVGRIAL